MDFDWISVDQNFTNQCYSLSSPPLVSCESKTRGGTQNSRDFGQIGAKQGGKLKGGGDSRNSTDRCELVKLIRDISEIVLYGRPEELQISEK